MAAGAARADGPKRYDVTLSDAKIGNMDLPAGNYKVLIHRDEMRAQLMDVRTGDTIDLPGKIVVENETFPYTEVHVENVDGARRVTEIRLGGTKYRIDFRQSS